MQGCCGVGKTLLSGPAHSVTLNRNCCQTTKPGVWLSTAVASRWPTGPGGPGGGSGGRPLGEQTPAEGSRGSRLLLTAIQASLGETKENETLGFHRFSFSHTDCRGRCPPLATSPCQTPESGGSSTALGHQFALTHWELGCRSRTLLPQEGNSLH